MEDPDRLENELGNFAEDPTRTDNPWEFKSIVARHETGQRAQYLQPWLNLVAGRPPAERDALLAEGREIWKYRMDTARQQLREMEGTEGPPVRVTTTVTAPEFLAEIVYRAEQKPEVGFLVYRYDLGGEQPPEFVDQIAYNGITFKPFFSHLYERGVVLLPSGVEEYGNDYKLFLKIKSYVEDNLHLTDDTFKVLACAYVLMTWLHDTFDVLPYLRAQGDLGTGKSRLLQTIGSICYRPVMAGGATTPAPIFRIIDRFHGMRGSGGCTLILDEADFGKSDMWDEITKIFNFGYQRGFPVLRAERGPGEVFDVSAYDCYGPKILATRLRFRDAALESRCLSYTMPLLHLRDIAKKIPSALGDGHRTSAQQLRNMLLLWRFRKHRETKLNALARYEELEPRINQIIQPILACIEPGSQLSTMIEQKVFDYSRQVRAERRQSIEGITVESVYKVWARSSYTDTVMLKAVTELLRTEHDMSKISDRKVGHTVFHTLGLPRFEKGGYTFIKVTHDRMQHLAERYGVDVSQWTAAPPPSDPPSVPPPAGV